MFWIFRKRKPLRDAAFYLDVAAGVLQARGKCDGKTTDDWGRVDAIGAMRIAVWGTTEWDQVKYSRRHELWEKYTEVKEALHLYVVKEGVRKRLPEIHPVSATTVLMSWNDTSTPHAVIDTMRQAAKSAKRS